MTEQVRSSERVVEDCCGGAVPFRTSRAESSGICPMSEMCAGVAGRMSMAAFLACAGVILIGLGILVLVAPKVLLWLVPGTVIVMGAAALAGAVAMRRRDAGPSRP